MIRISTRAYLQNLSTIGRILVRIFNVAEGWVVVDVQVGVSIGCFRCLEDSRKRSDSNSRNNVQTPIELKFR